MTTNRDPSDLESQWERALRPIVVLEALATRQSGTLIELREELLARGMTLDLDELDEVVTCLAEAGLIERRRSAPDDLPEQYQPTSAGETFVNRQRRRLSRLAGLADAEEVAAERAALAQERETIERLRSDLLSTVSHELRTPLTLIRTSIGLLLDSDPDEEMRLRLLRNIRQSSERMHTLVTDLLDLVRLKHDRADLQMRWLDAGALVVSVGSLIRPLIDERQQTLKLEIPEPAPRLYGDHRRLERLLLNLLSNANKFSPPGAIVSVAVEQQGDEVVFAVSDTGPGIPPEALPHLFEQFYTARTSSSTHNIGVGLGLPIAQGIAAAHGGRITVESEVGRGSTFRVWLPRTGRRPEEAQ
mgnify:FL=1